MRPISLYISAVIVLLAIFCSTSIGSEISIENEKSHYLADSGSTWMREKRQVENFDDEYPTVTSPEAQEEPGFWDRVVKVALKLFSKFIDWLNSS